MLWITRLDGLGEDTMKDEDMKVDYPDKLSIFLLGTSTGVKNPGRTATFGRLKNGGVGL